VGAASGRVPIDEADTNKMELALLHQRLKRTVLETAVLRGRQVRELNGNGAANMSDEERCAKGGGRSSKARAALTAKVVK
jgi:hypothetical protein